MNIQPLDSSFAEKLTAFRKHLQNITENDSVLFKQRKVKKMNDIGTALLLETSYHLSDVTHEPRFPTNRDGLSWMDHLNADNSTIVLQKKLDISYPKFNCHKKYQKFCSRYYDKPLGYM